MVPTIVIQDIKAFIVQNSTEAPSPALQFTACPTTGQDDYCMLGEDSKCSARSQNPSAVTFIIASQCLAFAMFGVVLTVQLAFAPGTQGTSKEEAAWYTVAMLYAVLSVTAKTSLEIGFIVMLTQMPESTLRASRRRMIACISHIY